MTDERIKRNGFAISTVIMSADLRFANVWWKSLQNPEEVATGLRERQPLLRSMVARAVGLKYAPQLSFFLDSDEDTTLIDSIVAEYDDRVSVLESGTLLDDSSTAVLFAHDGDGDDGGDGEVDAAQFAQFEREFEQYNRLAADEDEGDYELTEEDLAELGADFTDLELTEEELAVLEEDEEDEARDEAEMSPKKQRLYEQSAMISEMFGLDGGEADAASMARLKQAVRTEKADRRRRRRGE